MARRLPRWMGLPPLVRILRDLSFRLWFPTVIRPRSASLQRRRSAHWRDGQLGLYRSHNEEARGWEPQLVLEYHAAEVECLEEGGIGHGRSSKAVDCCYCQS